LGFTVMANGDVDSGAARDLSAGRGSVSKRFARRGVGAPWTANPGVTPGGRPRKTDMRQAMNAILYLLRTGCPWRYLPRDEFPPRSTVYNIFRRFQREGVPVMLLRFCRQCRRFACACVRLGRPHLPCGRRPCSPGRAYL